MHRTTLLPTALLSILLLAVPACAGEPPVAARPQPLLVFAAASLTDVFGAMEAAFEAAHPEYDVSVSFASSSRLREQVLDGAPADVFASADPVTMDQVVAAGRVSGTPAAFGRTRMQIAVPLGNPAGVMGIGDLARTDLLIGLCAEQIPCGAFAREVLVSAGVEASVDTYEASVRALLTKIEAGELDAGIVYLTDVAASPLVEGIEIPDVWNVDAVYPIAALSGSAQPDGADAFVEFVLSPAGREILSAHGFEAP